MRPFSGDDLIQAGPGTATLATPVSVTVPAATAEGNAGLIAMFAQAASAPPAQWDSVTTVFTLLSIMCRADLPAGESSWSFDNATGTPVNWTWAASEWANFASAPLETVAPGAIAGAGPASVSTGSTGSFSTQYVMGIAAFGIANTGTGSAWPSVSYSGGFTETDSAQVGTGTASGDLLLKVARLYGTDSDAGPWSCTATFTGSMTGKTAYAALAVFRAEETADPPMPVLSS